MTKDVPDYALMVGVPARQKGWMSRHAQPLTPNNSGGLVCPESGYRYEVKNGAMRCLDLDEDARLPEHLSRGLKSYDDFKVS